MKHLLRLLLFVILSQCCQSGVAAQNLQLQWAYAINSPGGTINASSIAVDSRGNGYVTGGFTGTVDFDPGTGTANLTSDTAFGKGASFLAKYDAKGNFLFVRQFGFYIKNMCFDKDDNLWFIANLFKTVDVDAGAGVTTLTSAGSSDFCVAKYDTAGNYINAFRIGGASSDEANAIAIDASGNIYVTGSFGSTVDFDPGAGTFNLTSNGYQDIFVAKYSAAGALINAFRLNGTGSSGCTVREGVGLAADTAGNIWLGGRFCGTLDLDPGPGTASYSSIGVDGFFAKYDASGNYLTGYSYNANVWGIGLDAGANLWVKGTMADSMDMDPGPGRAMLYSVNNFDVYFAKYDATGAYVHARAFQSNSYHHPIEDNVAITRNDGAYICGMFPDTVDVNPGGSGGVLISNGATDVFLSKYNAAGSFQQAFSFGSAGSENMTGLTVDKQGRIWMCGQFTGTVDLDPGPGTTSQITSTATAMLIAQYTDAETATGIRTASGERLPVKVWGSDNAIIIDFTGFEQVDAHVKLINMLGQTVTEADHKRNDMLRLALPDAAPQLYVAIVSNDGEAMAEKVWVR